MGEVSVQMEQPEAEPQIDWGRQEIAKAYARWRRVILAGETLLGAIYILALLIGGASVELQSLASRLDGNLVAVAIYFIIFYAGYALVLLPLSYFGGYLLSRRYGLSTQSPSGWLMDWVKGTALTLVLGLVLVEILYYTIAVAPAWWWLIMGAVVVLLSVVMANLAPVLIVPLFFRFKPVEDEELVARLVEMSSRAGAKVGGVFRIDLSSKTTAANAALMGLGNTRRIVLGDTLLDRYTIDEIETVYAHELGHHVHADIPVLILVQSLTTLVGFYVVGSVIGWGLDVFGIGSVGDVASLPLFALILGMLGVFWAPVTRGVSRYLEHRADVYALRFTGKARAFRNAMIRLCNQNLGELDPNRFVEFFLYDHPAMGSRIRLAERFLESQR
ncbi:MAG: M48 family metallopeptidase [Chloroflexi bacterium]|nr:M48 family metallopeptidase [Chloroflexota bacterium]